MEIKVNFLDKLRLEARFDDFTVVTVDGVWPVGHAASADLVSWGLSAGSMASSEDRAKAERAEQQQRRTQVVFAGVTM